MSTATANPFISAEKALELSHAGHDSEICCEYRKRYINSLREQLSAEIKNAAAHGEVCACCELPILPEFVNERIVGEICDEVSGELEAAKYGVVIILHREKTGLRLVNNIEFLVFWDEESQDAGVVLYDNDIEVEGEAKPWRSFSEELAGEYA